MILCWPDVHSKNQAEKHSTVLIYYNLFKTKGNTITTVASCKNFHQQSNSNILLKQIVTEANKQQN